jgi:hypothetical protein
MPPSGSYDPAIDASVSSAQRGNRYLVGGTAGVQGVGQFDTGDLDIAQRRGDEDLAIGLDDLGRNRGRTLADMSRSFQRLGNQQAQAMRSRNLRGGGVLQAAARRKANHDWDQNRVFEDQGDPSKQGDYGIQGRRMQLQHTRGSEDRTMQAGRATTELGAYESDARTSAWAQAKQANPFLTEPVKDPNEQTVGAQTYRLYRRKGGAHNKQLWKRLPSGRLVPRTDMTSVR